MVWHYYLIWIAFISIITFVLYGFDKAQARRGGRRVRETTLHLLALIGGFLGGWVGRSIFRHKTQKGVFTVMLIISTIIHLGLLYWLIFG